jgi:hypothetical protein
MSNPTIGRLSGPVTTTGLPRPDQAVLIADLRPTGGVVLALAANGIDVGSAPYGPDEHRRFAIRPVKRRAGVYSIRTATLRRAGEPVCLTHKSTALVATPCDLRVAAQLFEIVPAGTDAAGRHLFSLRTLDRHRIRLDPTGRVSVGHTGSPFSFVPWNTADAAGG